MEEARIISRTSTIQLSGNLEHVFPLFGPIREKEWAAGWDPKMVMPYHELVEEHMVFTTESGHAEAGVIATWIVSKYEPERSFIEYTVFTQGRIWWISVHGREGDGAEESVAKITYTYLGLSQEGHIQNQTALEAMFQDDLKDWERAINHYLETGTILENDHHSPKHAL